jgi:hypothetical protein
MLSDLLYWLIVWLLVSVPLALVVAQLLKATSEQLEREETEWLKMQTSGGRPFYFEIPSRSRRSRPRLSAIRVTRR